MAKIGTDNKYPSPSPCVMKTVPLCQLPGEEASRCGMNFIMENMGYTFQIIFFYINTNTHAWPVANEATTLGHPSVSDLLSDGGRNAIRGLTRKLCLMLWEYVV